MPNFLLPTPQLKDDADVLADWLEINAVCSEDGIGKLRELAKAMDIGGTADKEDVDGNSVDTGEEIIDELAKVNAVLEYRESACGGCYPFTVDPAGTNIRLNTSWNRSTYILMLLLCGFPANESFTVRRKKLFHARIFEALSVKAARQYFGGDQTGAESFHFAFPRPTGTNFSEALCELITATGAKPTNRVKADAEMDDGLDVFAWRPFKDKRSNHLSLFGQCAGGDNWDVKFPSPRKFITNWISLDSPNSIPAMFVPRMISERDFIKNASESIFFDRCRIASLVPSVADLNNGELWLTHALNKCGGRAERS